MYIGLHVKYFSYLSGFNETCIFSTDFRKILKYQISWISIEWEPSCSTWEDGGRTDMMTQIVTFLIFANAPNKLTSEGNKFYIRTNIIFWWKYCHNFKQKFRRFMSNVKFSFLSYD